MNPNRTLCLGLGLLSVFLNATSIRADDDAKIHKIKSQTDDSITFQISVGKTTFARGEDIVISYVVWNRNNTPVYLVVRPSPKLTVKELWILELQAPLIYPDAHAAYDYKLIQILPKKTYRGKLLIRAEQFLSNKEYNFEIAAIQTGFTYLFDRSQLAGCEEARYTLPCLKTFYDRAKTLTIGNLVVAIRQ